MGGRRTLKMWGGFENGKLDTLQMYEGYVGDPGNVPAIFTNKKAARNRYADVRQITITVSADG
jgi:hypothetical protein